MNMFTNVSSQVTGLGSSLGSWFKKDGTKDSTEEAPNAEEATNDKAPTLQTQEEASPANISDKSVKGSADENEDATSQHSGATEGADSNPPSEVEEDAGKAGFTTVSIADLELTASQLIEGLGFHLSGVSTRASQGAKSVGSFFSSAFSKAGASVKEASSRIKETVEKNSLLSEFNKEQEAFIKAKGGKPGQAVPPWIGYPHEDTLKEEILALSTDRRNFVRSPPTAVTFEFELEQFLPLAEATLAADPNLDKMRFELVPKVVTEEAFWRNYFYRVGLIRQSTELSSLEKENPGATESSEDTADKKDGEGNKGEEDWEAELREELGEELNEYEVVGGATKDNEKWEEELQNMLDDEDSTSDLR